MTFGFPTNFRFGSRIGFPAGGGGGAPFSPSDIGGMIIWLAADDLALADGAAVATWSDLSGNGKDFTQGTGASQPTLQTNEVNGKPIVRFDGTDDTLGNSTMADYAAWTFFIVYKSNNTNAAYVFQAGDAVHAIIQEFAAGAIEYFQLPQTTIGTTSTVNYQTITCNVGSTLGALWSVGGSFFGGSPAGIDVAEIIAYDSVLSAGNITSVQTYLDDKYGI